MKQESGKTRKQRQPANVKTEKPMCGTLSYMAECRGAQQKTGSVHWAAPPDSNNRIVRK
jgi:hypothetical protein